MAQRITFNLGPSTGLVTRQLTIRRHPGAGDDTIPIAAVHDADAGAVTTVAVTLANRRIFQAVLTDTLTSGEVIPPQSISFQTATLVQLGPRAGQPDGSQFHILNSEDLSSSSSSSSLSSSSSVSSSSSSVSSSSLSSSSSSSVSSSSLSSSSSPSSSSQSSSSSPSSPSSSSVP